MKELTVAEHDKLLLLLREAATIMENTDEDVHLPDRDIVILDGNVTKCLLNPDSEAGQDVKFKELGELIRYFADMID